MRKSFLVAVCSTLFFCGCGCVQTGAPGKGETPGPATAFTEKRPVYICRKVKGGITIDGQMNERCWRDKPWFPLGGLVDGSKPPHTSVFKMMWDDECLYFGGMLEDANVLIC